jgi:hypothetical protein
MMTGQRRRALLGFVVILAIAAAVVGATIRRETPVGEKLADSLDGAEAGFSVLGPCGRVAVA